tara:strand:+ start:1452 stop:2159 length:708 start_codon:yes stop_codon:yes gene_type:complete
MSSLDTMIHLHETNERLKEIQELKGNLPELLNKLKYELNEKNHIHNQYNTELKELNSTLKTQQSSLSESNNKLKKYNDQIFNVTNTKEYEALILETDQLKELINNLNSEISEINSKITVLEEQVELNQESVKKLSLDITKNEKLLSSEIAHTDKEEQSLIKHKNQLIKKVDVTYLGQYNKFLNKYGKGMSHIVRQSCDNCYTQLPAQMLVEIEYDKKIISCPSCSVFLYHKTEQD